MEFDSLNEQQRHAVEIVSGPVIVFAGAGSGKTRTLTFRIAHMIEKEIAPHKILAITFTNKATNEMRERLFQMVGLYAKSLFISTFHSLCATILRREIQVLGYKNHFEILDDEDQLKIIKEVLENMSFDKKVVTPKHMRRVINYCKTFDVKSEISYENNIIDKYESLMKELNLLDFNDLLLKVREIFTNYPMVLEKYQHKFQYILVDEFQDTDLIQYRIIEMLAQKHRNLFVVGDDDQSIYSFRGANYANMRLFKKDFSEYQMVILNQNYRSTQTILNGCNNLIKHNMDREAKELYSKIQGKDDDVMIHQALNDAEEVHFVIDEIKHLLANGYQHKDIAVLYRYNYLLRQFELGMIQSGLPYRVFGGISYLRRKEIKDMISYLRMIVYANDINSFQRIVNEPSRNLGTKTIQKLLDYRKQHKLTLFDAIDQIDSLQPSKKEALVCFKKMILSWQEKLEQTDLISLFVMVLEDTKYIENLDDDESKEDRIQNIQEFKSILYAIENDGAIETRANKLMQAFDEAVLADDKLQTQRFATDGITLSTVHSVKGLEFGCVFVVAFENNIFPSYYRGDESISLEEERRIAYVATTRAKNKLYLTCAHRRLQFGAITNNPQSQFLLEFIGESKQNNKNLKQVVIIEESEVKEKPLYQVGEFVVHTTYGEGIIVSLKDDIGQICFTKEGKISKFDMTHPSISKKRSK